MEKDVCTFSDSNSANTSTPSLPSMVAPHSPNPIQATNSPGNHQFAANFTTLYHSIFPPKLDFDNSGPVSPSPCSSASSSSDHQNASNNCSNGTNTVEHRLRQASFFLEYQQLYEHYDLCCTHLQDLTDELESLRRDNAALRLANKEIIKLLSLSSQAAMSSCLRRLGLLDSSSSGSDFTGDEFSGSSPTSVMDQGRFETRNSERVWIPKSISVRSSNYLKSNQHSSTNNTGSSRTRNPLQAPSSQESGKVQPRVHPPGSKKDDAFQVYSQGMFKTELCNKWQESGTCPYGDHCQFAHGISELRPVIRHPRYKTEVCRMVLAGDSCPYGHRCHFRHSLTEQEMVTAPRWIPRFD